MGDIITLRPSLLTWRNRVVLDGVRLTLYVQYRARTNDWFLDVLDPEDDPIAQGVRVVASYPLLQGVRDDRLPPGDLWAIRQGDPPTIARAGELGTNVLLYYLRQADFDEAAAEAGALPRDLIAPAAIKSVEDVI